VGTGSASQHGEAAEGEADRIQVSDTDRAEALRLARQFGMRVVKR